MTVTLVNQGSYTKSWIGLSTDQKPAQSTNGKTDGANNGDSFREVDTATRYIFLDGKWYNYETGASQEQDAGYEEDDFNDD